jgi:hypothetical protein
LLAVVVVAIGLAVAVVVRVVIELLQNLLFQQVLLLQ